MIVQRMSCVCLTTGIEEQLPQHRAWMTDEELICNLVKRFFSQCVQACWQLPICRTKALWSGWILVLSQHWGACNLIRWRSDPLCNTASCSCVKKKALCQRLPLQLLSFLSTQAQTCLIVSACSWLCTCWFIRQCSYSIWPTASYSVIRRAGPNYLHVFMNLMYYVLGELREKRK